MARIQGITIELGADASGIEQALKDVNKASSSTAKELGQINRALQFDSNNVNLLSQKFDVLQDAAKQTETKLNALREAQAEVNRQFQAGEIDASAYRAFQREIEQTEGRLRAFRQQAEDVQARIGVQADTTGIEKMKAALKELGPAAKQAASEIGSALSTAGTAGTAAVTGLVVGMADTNKDLAMLETQIGQVGLAFEDISNARTTFDSVGQETDQVTEAMGNLIQAGYATKESIDDISSSLAGAIVKYGDTFNVEGLAESITTTTQLGEVTGQLTDLLEKEGINVENFNAKIQSMSTEQERANYISQLLADQGLTSLYNKYAEGNAEIVNASSAQISMTDALSQLSTALTPLVTTVSEFVTKIVEWANENQGLATVLAVVAGAITALSGVFAVLSPIVSAITAMWPALAAAFGAISAPIAIAIAAVTALGVAAVALWKNWDEVSAFLQGVWQRIADTASNVFSGITDTVQRVWSAIESATSSAWNAIQNAIDSVLSAIESVISKYWSSIEDGVKKAWDGIKQYFDGVWDLIKNVFVGALLVVIQLLTGKWDEAKKSTEQIWKNIQDALKNVWEGIKNVFSGALDAVKGYIKTTWDNISSTTTTVFNAVKSAISSTWENVKSTTSSILNSIGTTVKNAFTSLVSSVSGKMKEVKSTIEKWWNQALSFLKGIDLSQIGRDMMQGLINGIKNMASNAIEAITGVVDGIVDKAKSLLKIKSPSRVMIEVGRWTAEGLAVGIEKNSGLSQEAARKMAQSVIDIRDDLNEQFKILDAEQLRQQEKTAQKLATVQKTAKDAYQKYYDFLFVGDFSSSRDVIAAENFRIEWEEAQSEFDSLSAQYSATLNARFQKEKLYIDERLKLNEISLQEELTMYRIFASTYAEQTEQRVYYDNLVAQSIDKIKAKEAELTKAYNEELERRTQTFYSFSGLFDEVTRSADVSGAKLIQNLQDQITKLNDWENAINELSARGLDTKLVNELRNLGVDAVDQIIALNSLTDEELSQYERLWEEKYKRAREVAEAELEDTRKDTEQQIASLNAAVNSDLNVLVGHFKNAGTASGDGLINGLKSKRPEIIATAQSIADAVASTIQSALDINSPSKLTRGFGVNVGQGLILGMEDTISKVAETSQRLSDAASNALGSLANSSAKSQAYSTSTTTSSSVDNSRHFNPSIVIHTNDSGSGAIDRTLRRLALKFN